MFEKQDFEASGLLLDDNDIGFDPMAFFQPPSVSSHRSDGARTRAPWLTVVMPIHNGEKWIEATLKSVLACDTDGIELLFIDSSDTPLSREIAERYRSQAAIRIIERPDLKGWTEKTNHGVAIARADHVVMLHQDDVWLPNRVTELKRWIATAPDAAVQFAPTAIIDDRGNRLGTWRCPLDDGPVARPTLVDRLLVQCFVSVPAPMFRRDAFLAAGGMDCALWYTADWDLWLKLATAGNAFYRQEVTTGFRVHPQSLTMTGSRTRGDFERQLRTVFERHASSGRASSRICEASIRINVALASAAAGSARALLEATTTLLSLGPVSLMRYLRYSRLLERALPRVRAGLAVHP
jgi:hypothetical protein